MAWLVYKCLELLRCSKPLKLGVAESSPAWVTILPASELLQPAFLTSLASALIINERSFTIVTGRPRGGRRLRPEARALAVRRASRQGRGKERARDE